MAFYTTKITTQLSVYYIVRNLLLITQIYIIIAPFSSLYQCQVKSCIYNNKKYIQEMLMPGGICVCKYYALNIQTQDKQEILMQWASVGYIWLSEKYFRQYVTGMLGGKRNMPGGGCLLVEQKYIGRGVSAGQKNMPGEVNWGGGGFAD
jgi:hypothetical protein